MEEEPTSGDIIVDISKSSLWEKTPEGYYKVITYPRPKFLGGNFDFSFFTLRTVCSFGELKENIRIVEVSGLRGREGRYFFFPHFLFPPNIWISDGHRFLFSMTALFRETTGRLPRKIVSLDLDYFSRISPERIDREIDNLILGIRVALQMGNAVMVDMHEDIGYFSKDTDTRQLPYLNTVEMINKGEVTDDNFLPFVVSGEGILIKPPLIEFSLMKDIKKGRLNLRVFNTEQLISLRKDFGNISLIGEIDMIHLATSPSYIDSARAFLLLSSLVKRFEDLRLTNGRVV